VRAVVEVGGFFSPLPTLSAMALYEAHRGREERAVELFALASRSPFVANSRWFDDVIGQPIAAATVRLQPEAVARAQERGQALDRETTMAGLAAEL
jgi:hypothetical protein